MKNILMSLISAVMLTGTVFAADYSLPSFIFPDTGIPFVNRVKQLCSDTAGKDFSDLFGSTALNDESVCGYTKEDIAKIYTTGFYKYYDTKNLAETTGRNTGVDMFFGITETINPEFISFSCPSDKANGEITYRYVSKTDSVIGKYESHSTTVNVVTMYLNNINEPDYIRTLSQATVTGNLPIPTPSVIPAFRDMNTGETVLAVKVNGNSSVIYIEQLGDKKTRLKAWDNGNLLTIQHMKKGLYHGTFEMKERRTKIMGTEYVTPGWTRCYSNGVEVKTTGECNVD